MKKQLLSMIIAFIMVTLMIPYNEFIIEAEAAPSADYKLTGNQVDDIIAVARAQKDKKAKDFNFNIDWCALFVHWSAKTASIANDEIFPKKSFSDVVDLCKWFVENKKGAFYYFLDSYKNRFKKEIENNNLSAMEKDKRENFIPKKGDLIVFCYNSTKRSKGVFSHVGIVYSVNMKDGTLNYVHGNAGSESYANNIVKQNSTKYKTNSSIIGYIRPDYKEKLSVTTIKPTETTTPSITTIPPLTTTTIPFDTIIEPPTTNSPVITTETPVTTTIIETTIIKPCNACTGAGRTNCTSCNGMGEFTCSTCKGTNLVLIESNLVPVVCPISGDIIYRTAETWGSCNQCWKGFETCMSCLGQGTVRCSSCYGTGTVN